MPLTARERATLRRRAHPLRPSVQVGRQGLTEAVLRQVDEALLAHELIKVQLAGDRDERADLAAALAETVGAEPVGLVGRIAILYRPHPDPERRRLDPHGPRRQV